MQALIAYLKLMRPANILTAIADIMLGFAASGALNLLLQGSDPIIQSVYFETFLWLIVATTGLYGGGVVFNDFFDAALDARERPERPIPSGVVSKEGAARLGAFLYIAGILSAFQVSIISGIIAIIIAALATLYDVYSKHNNVLGPLNMGLCRAGNLLLGLSALTAGLTKVWFLGFIPLIYIGAITMISRGEVHGGNKNSMRVAFGLYTIVIAGIIALSLLPDFQFLYTIPFLLLFIFLIFRPLIIAYQQLQPPKVEKAVKAGVLSLIVLNATIAAGFAGWIYGLLILLLLPLSRLIANKFAVT